MAVPKKKISKSRRGHRRSHDALRRRLAMVCPRCGEHKLPHHICSACGYYGPRLVITKTEHVS